MGTELIIGNTNTAFIFPACGLLDVDNGATPRKIVFKMPMFPVTFTCFEFTLYNGQGQDCFSKIYLSVYFNQTGIAYIIKNIHGTTLDIYFKKDSNYIYMGIQESVAKWQTATLDCIRVANYMNSLNDKIENYKTLGVSMFKVSDWTGYTKI